MRFLRNHIVVASLLALFVFPQAYSAWHSFGHKDDFHCLAVDEKHFHQTENSCDLCDHLLPSSAELWSQQVFQIALHACLSQVSNFKTLFISNDLFDCSGRGPPSWD